LVIWECVGADLGSQRNTAGQITEIRTHSSYFGTTTMNRVSEAIDRTACPGFETGEAIFGYYSHRPHHSG
jgi:hypothetical protein